MFSSCRGPTKGFFFYFATKSAPEQLEEVHTIQNGEKVEKYNGKRAIEDLEAFINKHAAKDVGVAKDEL